jgi:hypothetical protein
VAEAHVRERLAFLTVPVSSQVYKIHGFSMQLRFDLNLPAVVLD